MSHPVVDLRSTTCGARACWPAPSPPAWSGLMTHHDVDDDDVERACKAVAGVPGSNGA